MILVAAVTVLAVRSVRRKKRIHDNHVHDNTSQYNMVSNSAYNIIHVSRNETVDGSQEDVLACEELSCTASSEDQTSTIRGHDDRNESDVQVQCYEDASGPYEQVHEYEQQQVSDPYERIQEYEQQQVSGPYERIQKYEQLNGPYERIQDYEQQQVSGPYDRIQVYEHLHV